MSISELERVGREAGMYFTATDLMSQVFPEPRWAVPGLIAEGLNMLVGAPKLGKSWLCLGLAVSIASGGKALGKIDVKQGPVLYAALEDTPRRLQNRLNMVLGDEPVPTDLHIATALPRLPILGEFLEGWLDQHLDARLIIIDVLRKVRPLEDGRGNAYNEDYDTLSTLKKIADRYQIAIIVVHHTRKMLDDGDVFNEVSGSTGLTGAADAILIAKRARNTDEAILHLTGRDVTEHDFGMTWNSENCTWHLTDTPAIFANMGTTRRTILDYVTENEGASPQEISTATGIKVGTVHVNVRRMSDDDQLDSDGQGRYFPSSRTYTPPETGVSPVSTVSLPSPEETQTYSEDTECKSPNRRSEAQTYSPYSTNTSSIGGL